MSPLLCRKSRATGHTRATRTGSERRASRLAGLATAALAVLALAAAPVSDAARDAAPEAIASALGTTLASMATTALDAPVSDGRAEPGDRTVRTAVATPPTLAERTAYEPATEPHEPTTEPDEPAADEPAAEGGDPAQPDPDRDDADTGAESTHRSVWDDLADCESGDRDTDGTPITGTARWDYGRGFAHEGYEQFEGGLNFAPGTWDAYRDPGMPDHAGDADRAQEIVVGERVKSAQGWSAWPVCSEMLGLR